MKSIRWKLVLLCVVVMLVPILCLNWYTFGTFGRFTSHELEERMIDSAFLVGEQYKGMLDAGGVLDAAQQARLTGAVQTYEGRIRARIQVLSTNGVVLADSSTNAAPAAGLSGLPEVQSALRGKYRARFALTDDRQYLFYYVALPIQRDGKVCGVVYLSRHTGHVTKISIKLQQFQRLTTALAIVAGLILAVILAYSLTSRLRKLTVAATAFARGQAPLDVRVGGRDEIAELARAIGQMATELQRTNQYNREFIATVMHELKMPVTAIQGAAELLEHGAFAKEEARVKFLGNIRFESERLARMIWELGELTKLDTEIPHAPKETVDYGACVREIVERFETTLDSAHAAIQVNLPAKPVFAKIIPGRIEQVLGNLLDNAVRYTPATGRIGVTVEPGADHTVSTTVRDTGCGIAPANLGKVFGRFFTTEPRDRPRDYGSGLGLAIAKSIIENHRGTITVESAPGQGATFCFRLPACAKVDLATDVAVL
jgi:signal transduction histidine kinase